MKNLRIIVLFLILLSSCSTENKKNEEYLSKRITAIMPTLNKCYSHIIIIPGSGCSGCITVAEDFLKDNYKNPECLFILTSINSLKIINHKIGINVSQLPNVILDYDNVYSRYNMPIYPIVINYNCKERKVKNIVYQKPGSNAFDEI
ncbi:MAG TPA: hypothetical protein VLZ83_02110 [Edaphocola sp.]|nr:hypothetical protein [Edaphocola sp.]